MLRPAPRRVRSLSFTLVSTILLGAATVAVASAQTPASTRAASAPTEAPARTPADVYDAACAACHGADGKGVAQSTVGFDTPVPDFGDCNFATREPDADWGAIAHGGGPVRGFSRMMPAFGDALSADDIQLAIDHIRSFCGDPGWPRGELNLPRALFTEKAYPEDEAVWTTGLALTGPGEMTNELVYERRFGAVNQVEFKLPLAVSHASGSSWNGGAGDIGVGFKRVMHHDLSRGRIMSVAGEIVLPTGDESSGQGSGALKVEPFVSFGQILRNDAFFQAQAGTEFSANRSRAGHEAFWRAVVGQSFVQGRDGRVWTPMVELLGARELEAGARVEWDLVPQVQMTLNTRQHVMLGLGLRVPVTRRDGRSNRLMVYLLWDWFDGGLFDGW